MIDTKDNRFKSGKAGVAMDNTSAKFDSFSYTPMECTLVKNTSNNIIFPPSTGANRYVMDGQSEV